MSDGTSTPPAAEPGPRRTPRPRPAPPAPAPAQLPAANPPTEYDETLVAGAQVAVSVAIAVVLAVVLVGIRTSLWPFAIVVFLAVGGVGVYLAGISVTATRTYIEIGQGRGERDPRRISRDDIVAASAADFSWAQVFGVGLPRDPRTTSTTRVTVRPGPTLVLELRSGEVVRVSTPDPARALAVLGPFPV